MPRYVDADKADKIIEEKLGFYDTTELKEMLGAFPTEDVTPVIHASLIMDDDGYVHCSGCGKVIYPFVSFIKYCPNCGAKMDKEVTSEETNDGTI